MGEEANIYSLLHLPLKSPCFIIVDIGNMSVSSTNDVLADGVQGLVQ